MSLITAVAERFGLRTTTAAPPPPDRRRLVEELAALRPTLQAEKAKHDQLIAPLASAEAAAKSKYEAAATKLQGAKRERERVANAIQRQIDIVEGALRASAPPAIAATHRAIADRFARDRHGMARSRVVVVPGQFDNKTFRPLERTLTNQPAIDHLLAEQRVAFRALETFELQHPDDLDAALAAILGRVDAAWQALETFDAPNSPAAA